MSNEANIKKNALFGTVWKFLERIIAQGVSLVVSIILARILEPTDYSVVGLVAIFFTFANVLISGGFNTALIQKRDADIEDYSSIMIFSLGVSVVVYVILFFCAPLISGLYNQEILVPIIRVMGLTLPVNALKSIVCAYTSSHLQFKKFFFATIGGTLFSAALGILMAENGFGAWSLVAQQMSNAVIDTVILYLSTRLRFVLKVNVNKLKSLINYSWKILVSQLIGAIYTELNPLFIGLRFTPADLSFYSKGKGFPELISTTTNNTLSAVLFPVMAKFQDDKQKLLNYTRLFIGLSSYLLFPLMFGFFVVADKFVLIVLTEKWMPAVPFIRIFCLALMFEMVHTGNCQTIKAMGRSDIYLIMDVIKKVCYFITIGVFMLFSKSAVMLAVSAIVCNIIALVVNCIPNIKLLGYKIRYQIIDLLPNMIISLIMAAGVYLVGLLRVSTLPLMIIQILCGALFYFVLSLISKNKNFKYYISIVKEYIFKVKTND